MISYFDSHAHLTSPEVYGQLPSVLERAQQAHVKGIVNICTDVDTLEKGLALECPWVYHTAATTPHDVDKEGEENFPFIAAQARKKRLVAIGETGLDYHYMHSAKETQKKFFLKYLNLALECQLPVVIHCRDAFADFFEIIDQHYQDAPGILHCFTGTFAEAQEVIKRGWFLSLSGIITFKKSEELRKVAQWAPLEQLLIETDTPYLAPQGKRGKMNEPSFLPFVAHAVAEAKGLPLEIIGKATAENARRAFRIGLSAG